MKRKIYDTLLAWKQQEKGSLPNDCYFNYWVSKQVIKICYQPTCTTKIFEHTGRFFLETLVM